MIFFTENEIQKGLENIPKYTDKEIDFVFKSSYTLLSRERFAEVIVNALIDSCLHLRENDAFLNIISKNNYLRNLIDDYECDWMFVINMISCVSLIFNYDFENSILWLGRLSLNYAE